VRVSEFVQLAQRQPRPRSVEERLARRYLSVEDVRRAAARRLPRSVFDYIEGGGEDEAALRRNRASFADYSLVPYWSAVSGPSLSTDILGVPSTLPLMLSPTGGSRLFHPEGELAVARAAAAEGVPYTLAHLSTVPLEDVAAAAPTGTRWFNIELGSDLAELDATLDRLRAAGYDTLFVNLDVRAIGHRERDYRNGFTAPPTLRPRTAIEGMLHPAWSLRFLAGDAIAFPNLDSVRPTSPLSSSPDMWRSLLSGSYEPTDWSDVEILRRRWEGRIVLKGCVNPRDVARAASLGIDAVQVSNHGGRQLDHMASPMDVLPEIVAAADGRLSLIVDGGVRRGTDVVKALALGADAVAIGRPYLYGLAAHGEAGVRHVLRLFTEEITRTMLLLGTSSVAELRHRGQELLHRIGQRGSIRLPEPVSF
jgi:L-lactate dehydrogenase (cytochrome)